MNLTPNCSWRDVVEVLVICPKLVGVEPPCSNTVTMSGSEKFARLNRLKASALNCTVARSPILLDFKSEMSTVNTPGPINTFLPTLPNCPAGAIVNAFGLMKACGSPVTALPGVKPGTQSGLSTLSWFPSLELLKLIVGLNGLPECAVMIVFASQPPKRKSATFRPP